MTKTNGYLQTILQNQTLASDSSELNELREKRTEVENLLNEAFSGADLRIRYGGSKAKGTMIRSSYDLDVISYFGHDESQAGDSLREIYESVHQALSPKYYVEQKTSALRLRDPGDIALDSHIDVVPGRFTDDTRTFVFLHQNAVDKERLKTNLQIHIDVIRDSGVRDAIKLIKYWKHRNRLLQELIETFQKQGGGAD